MAILKNRAKMSTSTTGTGTITLGSAETGYQTFADAGVVNADVVRYVIEDGNNWEIGTGTYTASGTTLSRTVTESSSSGAAISLTGSATVFITATAEDLVSSSAYVTPVFAGARWKFTSTQSGITNNTLTNYTTRDYDTTSNNDFTSTNSRLTVPAGVSRVVVKASAETSSVSSQSALKIKMNGGDIESTNIDIDSSGGDYVFATTPVIEVTQGDYFEASLFSQNSRSVLVDDRFTWFEIQVIEGSMLNMTINLGV